jgi:hypothetical protein
MCLFDPYYLLCLLQKIVWEILATDSNNKSQVAEVRSLKWNMVMSEQNMDQVP